MPVTFGVLTTVAAFVPLLLIEGARGQIFAQIPMIVIPVLLFSLVESKLILPAHLRHVNVRGADGLLARMQQRIADGLETCHRQRSTSRCSPRRCASATSPCRCSSAARSL